jgi:hypothetical protein
MTTNNNPAKNEGKIEGALPLRDPEVIKKNAEGVADSGWKRPEDV